MKKKHLLLWCQITNFHWAIGKAGQNARLAAKLTNWKIDIKSETQAAEAGEYVESDDMISLDAFGDED